MKVKLYLYFYFVGDYYEKFKRKVEIRAISKKGLFIYNYILFRYNRSCGINLPFNVFIFIQCSRRGFIFNFMLGAHLLLLD